MIQKMKCNEPIEVKGAIPLLVSRFARDLSRSRRLDVVFQSECRIANRERVNCGEIAVFGPEVSGAERQRHAERLAIVSTQALTEQQFSADQRTTLEREKCCPHCVPSDENGAIQRWRDH